MTKQRGPFFAGLLIALILLAFLVIPVVQVIYVAFQDPASGALTLVNFSDFFRSSLFQESFAASHGERSEGW
ncbi:hypothetical protein [Thiolapillus sp.]|uniref:hypothetical protein n=1 Tax=Thiolapillus sp. TaxID=2017437 RepID=UPI003AF569A6